MMLDPIDLILASTSAYRRAQLERLALEFECVDPAVDESFEQGSGKAAREVAELLAEAKALAVASRRPDALVIGADQLVELDGELMGKPGDAQGCFAQLTRLSGKTHQLITAVALVGPASCPGGGRPIWRYCDVHRMTMRSLSDEEIRRYVQLDAPHGCAGSYMIERAGISLFERIEGEDFTAIEGLPLMGTASRLRQAGLSVP